MMTKTFLTNCQINVYILNYFPINKMEQMHKNIEIPGFMKEIILNDNVYFYKNILGEAKLYTFNNFFYKTSIKSSGH